MNDHPTTEPTDRSATVHRPDPTSGRVPDWSGVRSRSQAMAQWTEKAVSLAAEAATEKPVGRFGRWRNRRAAARAAASAAARTYRAGPATRPVDPPGAVGAPVGRSAGRLRFIPPVAALGTAFVLQVIAMTDVVGGSLATSISRSDVQALADHPEVGYLAAMLLGIAVASCAEGGAAYLMDLYDKHLLARDSVWMLKLAMVGYVAASAGVIHWWCAERNLPSIVAWVLAGMSGSALFLWSMGSRWRNREAMREAGQLDPAMPRLAAPAKVLHPIRWIVTLYLVSWEPAATTEEARARYDQWAADRATRKAGRGMAKADREFAKAATAPSDRSEPVEHKPTTAVAGAPAVVPAEPAQELATPADPTDMADPADRPDPTTRPLHLVHGPTAVADAGFLRHTYGDDPTGLPGRNEIWRIHGGNKERWTNALKAYADRADQPTTSGTERATA